MFIWTELCSCVCRSGMNCEVLYIDSESTPFNSFPPEQLCDGWSSPLLLLLFSLLWSAAVGVALHRVKALSPCLRYCSVGSGWSLMCLPGFELQQFAVYDERNWLDDFTQREPLGSTDPYSEHSVTWYHDEQFQSDIWIPQRNFKHEDESRLM